LLGIALLIPLGNFIGLIRAKSKWLEKVTSANVERPVAKTTKSVDNLSKRDRLFDITDKKHPLYGTVLRHEGGDLVTSQHPAVSQFTALRQSISKQLTMESKRKTQSAQTRRRKSLTMAIAAIHPHTAPETRPNEWTDRDRPE
jgi:hypothetical protein